MNITLSSYDTYSRYSDMLFINFSSCYIYFGFR